jgi:hypothetical protein
MNRIREADATYERWRVTQSPVESNQEQCFNYYWLIASILGL